MVSIDATIDETIHDKTMTVKKSQQSHAYNNTNKNSVVNNNVVVVVVIDDDVDDAFVAAVCSYGFQLSKTFIESYVDLFCSMKTKVPSSKNQTDVINYMTQQNLIMVMTLTKLKPNKGATSSPTGRYWEVANMIPRSDGNSSLLSSFVMSTSGRDYKNLLVIRSGNKRTNENGSNNRIRYAMYCRIPKEVQSDFPVNIDFKQFHVLAKQSDNDGYEDQGKVVIDKHIMFRCQVAEDDFDYFLYMALWFDISQNASKSQKHLLQVQYRGVPFDESCQCKFVSGRGNPNCILSNKTHSEERTFPSYDVKEIQHSMLAKRSA